MRNIRITLTTMARCTASRVAIALLIGGIVAPSAAPSAAATTAATAAAAQDTSADQQAIVITAPPIFRDIQPERVLDQDGIESYGISTIDELMEQVEAELGEEDEFPLIFVNGKQLNDLSEIGALPVEALRSLQVLPRGSAVRAGGSPGQRVVSLSLKPHVKSATLTGAHKISTDGDWNADRGEAILTKVDGQTRANIAFRVRDDSRLLESDRGIIQPAPFSPYALTGNVVGYPNTKGEIDPTLSALAGQIVTVTPVPSATNPTLADFLAGANQPATTDLGRFRTLRPNLRNYDFNAGGTTDVTSWLTANATLHWNRSVSRGQRGLPTALFILSSTNPASPFSRNVGLLYYGENPLRYRSTHNSGDANLTLNGTFGAWISNFHAQHTQSKDVYDNDRQTTFGAIPLDDSVNPFARSLSNLIGIATQRTTSRSYNSLAELQFTGPTVKLPAGPVQTTIEGKVASDILHSRSDFGNFGNQRFRRNTQSIRGAVDLPIAGTDSFAKLGQADATAEYTLFHYSDAGTLHHYALGLNWQPSQRLQLGSDLIHTELPPSIQLLGNPVIVTEGVRVFDPLTGQTVDVTQITGGNPGLKPETDRIFRLNGLYRLVPRLSLQLNADYTDSKRKNFVSALPEASAAIMLAFPDRFIRDADGVLTTVDLRPVNFESEHERRFRWGLSMNTKLGGGAPPGKPGAFPILSGPRTYFQLTANHTMVFSDDIVIRPGLDKVDLLKGGAIGIAGGRVRHQVDASAAITEGGTGARVALSWRGPSTLVSTVNGATDTLHFSSVLALNLRAFTTAQRFFPRQGWAKNLRLSLDVLNITNYHQRVRDSFGNTPLQYQAGYRDPVGRTIEIELRKVF